MILVLYVIVGLRSFVEIRILLVFHVKLKEAKLKILTDLIIKFSIN